MREQPRGRGRPPTDDTLTPGEWSVLHLVRHGLSNRQIARLRRTTVGAIRFHVRNIGAKVGLHDRGALRQWAGLPLRLAQTKVEGTMTTQQGQQPAPQSAEPPGITGVGQISIYIHDVARTESFYRDTLWLTPFLKYSFISLG